MAGWRLERTYAELPQLFYSHAAPTAVREPRLVAFNRPLATRSADFTNTFRLLTTGRLVGHSTNADPELEAWHRRLEARRGRQPQSSAAAEALMRRHNPAFIPRNHNVEEALLAATSRDDFSVMERLVCRGGTHFLRVTDYWECVFPVRDWEASDKNTDRILI